MVPTTQQQISNIFSGGGSSGGGSSSGTSTAANIKAEQERQAELLIVAKEAQLEAQRAEQAIATAKSFAEKTQLASVVVEQRKVAEEAKRIAQERQRIINAGGQIRVRNLIDSATRQPIQTTNTILKDGTRVFQIRNLVTGEVRTKTFATPKGGGGARQTGELTIGTTQKINTNAGQDKRKSIMETEKEKFLRQIENRQQSRINIPTTKVLVNYNFKNPASAIKTTSEILKAVLISGRSIPNVIADYGISIGKGFTKIGLYAIDEAGYTTQIRYNKQTGKLIIPSGTKALTDKLGTVKKWAGYDFKTNPLRDPDLQNVAVTTAFVGLGIASAGTAAKVYGAIKGKAIYDAIRNPTEYNIAIVESLLLPGMIKKAKKTLARRDVIVAKSGDLVPLKERITQVDYLIKNSGKSIDAVTATPKRRVIIKKITSKSNPDYAYGNRVEFATYKVGRAYPTSEYFLKGKAKGIQKLLKTGSIKIEKVTVSKINAKYGAYIKRMLLSKGRVSESFIKKYYAEAKLEANRLGKPVAVVSPKRLRGFAQPEQEMIKILPDNYKPTKTRFAGITEEGYRVFSDKSYAKNLRNFIKTKFQKGKIDNSYWEAIARDKLEYLKGRPAIRGEYAEHGKAHLLAENVDPYARNYARKMVTKKFGNTFKQHDLAKVGDADSFVQFEHGKVLYELWKRGKYPDKNIYKLPKPLQKQIADAYAGHTPVKPRLLDTLIKGWKENSITKDFIWWAKNKRNPILQDTLTIDRLELPRQGRWNIKVKYNLLDKNALKRIYGSELNAVKNIRFLDWKTVPGRLRRAIGKTELRQIAVRDRRILLSLKKLKSSNKILTRKYKTAFYNSLKNKNYKLAYKKGYESGYKSVYKKPTNYSTQYGKYQKFYAKGYSDAYKGDYKIVYKGGKYVPVKYTGTPVGYKPRKYHGSYTTTRKRSPIKPLISLPTLKSFQPKTLPKKVETYYVVEKVRGKFKKLYPKPLTAKDAKDYAVYSIDNRLSKTAFFIPMGKARQIVRPPKNIQDYYIRNSQKVRPYKIRFGVKKQLVNGFIEKRKYFQDTRGERISARNLRRKTLIRRTIPKRRFTLTQRKVMLANLKKARAARRRK